MKELNRYLRGIKDLAVGYGVPQAIIGIVGIYSWVLLGSLFV